MITHYRALVSAGIMLSATTLVVIILAPRLGANTTLIVVLIEWAALALFSAGLAYHKPLKESFWYLVWIAVLLGALTDTLTMIPGRTRDMTYLPGMIGYLASYAAGVAASVKHVQAWRLKGQTMTAMDVAAFVGATLTLLGSVTYIHMDRTTASLISSAGILAFLAFDAAFLIPIGRLTFSVEGRLWAYQIVALGLGLHLLGHILVALELVNPAMSFSWAHHMYVWLYVMLGLAATLPSSAASRHDVSRRDTSIRRQLIALSISLLTPSIVLVVFGSFGEVPWPAVSVGGTFLAVHVVMRIYVLVQDLRSQEAVVQELARSDALTGAPNRRRWEAAVSDELAQVESRWRYAVWAAEDDGQEPMRTVSPQLGFWVGIIDFDHFKNYNDTYGHQKGDTLLIETVRRWKELLTGQQLVARYGGEEFMVLVPEPHRAHAVHLVERMRSVVPDNQTCSVGLVQWVPGARIDDLIRAADRALYQAKAEGRDRVVVGSVHIEHDVEHEQRVLQTESFGSHQ